MRYKTMAITAILLMLVTVLSPIQFTDASTGGNTLVDEGDGTVHWAHGSGDTVIDMALDALDDLGIPATYSEGVLTVDGRSSMMIGSEDDGGTFSTSGTTGTTVTTSWRTYGWTGDAWESVDPNAAGSGYSHIAVGFYPDGVAPVVTPDDPYAVTMFRGDALNTGHQDATYSSSRDYTVSWTDEGAAFANPLYAGGYIFQKYCGDYNMGVSTSEASLVCIDPRTGEHVWEFEFLSGTSYESSTPVIVGDYIYLGTMTHFIYKIPWKVGPGENNGNVTSYGGVAYGDAQAAPSYIRNFDIGTSYDSGFSSLIYSDGAIYTNHSNGMAYCFDLDLNLIWSYQMDGCSYFIPPTVTEDHVFTSALNGHMYILDKVDGSVDVDQTVFQIDIRGKTYGGLGQIAVLDDGVDTTLMFTITDGRGMSQTYSGLAVYGFDPASNTLVKKFQSTDLGIFGRFVSPMVTEGFSGVYVTSMDGGSTSLLRVDTDGHVVKFTEGLEEIHTSGVIVNDEWIYLTSYAGKDPVYRISLKDGSIEGVAYSPEDVRNFNMAAPLVFGDLFLGTTDSGIFLLDGSFQTYVPPSGDTGAPIILYLGAIVAVLVVLLMAVWAFIRFVKHEERPFRYLKDGFLHYLYGENLSHNTRNRHRLRFVLLIGVLLILGSFTMCISIGSTSVMNPIDAYAALFSAISKGGVGLDTVETSVFVSRLPRTIAAMAVGIGLAIAGSVYQAIIRNPLVDPYIMGVSSGAGIAAIAVIAFDFTFFGFFSNHSIFLTAISAVIGGLVAFGCTMLIAERSGGSSINYVLAGVVVGLAFSALQTIMLTMAGNKLNNALSWLYGSFAEVTWEQVGIVLFLSVFLSAIPLFWAKEFNLVLLGEDQAREMGLDVKRFNRWMLILASVLTSVCVAFCGVIGFVGLVIPHLCRMLLGSDHRMVLPASFCFGAVMLMLADLLSRTGYYGMELPVGAITTIIGIPVFAYLLIKKGRMYDG